MLIDEQNKKGGLLGKKLEAVVVDPASNWPLFAEKARELISKDKVAAVFGCWTSVSRKSVLPVFEELNAILFYPVQYEGEESERNVFYTGAAPNQQAIPAVDYLMSEEGGSVKRWVLAGTDYVYPRTTNKILEAYLKPKGVARRRHHDQLHAVRHLRLADRSCPTSRSSARPARRPRWSRPSTATPTCRSTRSSATRASRRPTSRSSPSRSARKSSPASTPSRWSAISPPGTTSSRSTRPANKAFIEEVAGVHQEPEARHQRPDGSPRHRLQHVGEGGREGRHHRSRQGDRRACIGVAVPNLTGGISTMMPNHHITKPVLIGEIQADGQFDVVWKTAGPRRRATSGRTTCGLQGPDRRLGRRSSCGNFNAKHRQVRRPGSLTDRLATDQRTAAAASAASAATPAAGIECDACLPSLLSSLCCSRSRFAGAAPAPRAAEPRRRAAQASPPTSFSDIDDGDRRASPPAAIRAPTPMLEALQRRPPAVQRRRQGGLSSRTGDGKLLDAAHRRAGRRRRRRPTSTRSASTTALRGAIEAALGGLTLLRPIPATRLAAAAGGVQVARRQRRCRRSRRRSPRRHDPRVKRALERGARRDRARPAERRRGRQARRRRDASRERGDQDALGAARQRCRRRAGRGARRGRRRAIAAIERQPGARGTRCRTSGTASRSARCCCSPRSASPSPSA